MEQNLYLIFNETYDDLCMMSASLYNDVKKHLFLTLNVLTNSKKQYT